MTSEDKKILIADDDLAILRQFEYVLVDAGYSVTAVSNGEVAYDALTTRIYDVVLTDLQMGGAVGGVTIVGRSVVACPNTKVIVVTGMVGLANSAVGQEGFPGSYSTLFKPVSNEDLLKAVEAALNA